MYNIKSNKKMNVINKTEDQDEAEASAVHFMNLPVEVRVGIFGLLLYPDLLSVRHVNRQLKKEVDEHMEFHIKFDQSNHSLKRLLQLRIKSCHVINFRHQKQNHRRFSSKVFGHPGRVKKLTFDGPISRTNLFKILNQCQSVEHLVFTHETLGIEGIIEKNIFNACLPRLNLVTHLNLQLLRYPLGDPFEAEENVEAFLGAYFPHLQSFHLYYSVWGKFYSLLKFLERHHKTLKDIELQVGDRGDSRNTENYLRASPLKITASERKNLLSLNLTKFRFRDDVLNLNRTAKDLVTNILLSQSHLQVLQFYSPGELSWSTLASIISSNAKSLTEIVVYNVQSATTPPNGIQRGGEPAQIQIPEMIIDMTIFSKCSQLSTLALSCASSNGNDPNVIGSVLMKMNNLHCISFSIERLHLTGFTLVGQELVYLTNKTNKLKEVLIADAGTMRYSDVLNSFLKNCKNLCYLNVRPVVLQAANEELWWTEVQKLSKLYERFMGISYDPIDDLEGFEANINASDKEWLRSYSASLSVYSNSELID